MVYIDWLIGLKLERNREGVRWRENLMEREVEREKCKRGRGGGEKVMERKVEKMPVNRSNSHQLETLVLSLLFEIINFYITSSMVK